MSALLIIVILLVVAFIYFRRTPFTPQQTSFQKQIQPLLDRINKLINSNDFNKLKVYVPGLTNLNLDKSTNTIVKEITKGDIPKLNEMKDTTPQLISDCDTLTKDLTELISLAQNSEGVYTPSQLNAFTVYYTNLLNNVNLIKKNLV